MIPSTPEFWFAVDNDPIVYQKATIAPYKPPETHVDDEGIFIAHDHAYIKIPAEVFVEAYNKFIQPELDKKIAEIQKMIDEKIEQKKVDYLGW
jgi:hypothetical protein